MRMDGPTRRGGALAQGGILGPEYLPSHHCNYVHKGGTVGKTELLDHNVMELSRQLSEAVVVPSPTFGRVHTLIIPGKESLDLIMSSFFKILAQVSPPIPG